MTTQWRLRTAAVRSRTTMPPSNSSRRRLHAALRFDCSSRRVARCDSIVNRSAMARARSTDGCSWVNRRRMRPEPGPAAATNLSAMTLARATRGSCVGTTCACVCSNSVVSLAAIALAFSTRGSSGAKRRRRTRGSGGGASAMILSAMARTRSILGSTSSWKRRRRTRAATRAPSASADAFAGATFGSATTWRLPPPVRARTCPLCRALPALSRLTGDPGGVPGARAARACCAGSGSLC
jgi:hypothetical protein